MARLEMMLPKQREETSRRLAEIESIEVHRLALTLTHAYTYSYAYTHTLIYTCADDFFLNDIFMFKLRCKNFALALFHVP